MTSPALQTSGPLIHVTAMTGRDNCTSAEERLKKTLFVVEATSFEQQSLWEKWSTTSRDRPDYITKPVRWEQINPGWAVNVGKETHVSFSWARIDGHFVCFYEPTSRIVDNGAVEAWLKKHFKGRWDSGSRRATCDANNFHLCINAVRDANTPQVDKYPDLQWIEEELFHDQTRGLREKGKKIVVLATQWGPFGADNPTMQYKYRVEDEDPIKPGKYYTELETPRLLELANRIRPVFRPPGTKELWSLRDFKLTIDYLRETAFIWDPKPGKKQLDLVAIHKFKSYHAWAYYGNFKPDVAETLAQIPAEFLDKTVAFEISDVVEDQEALNEGYHVATCTLYARK